MTRLHQVAALLLLVAGMAYGQGNRPEWKAIRDTLGRQGKVDSGVLRITYPRTDLGDVKIGDDTVDSDLVYESWFGFVPMDGATMMMGDFCLTEQELPVVQKYLVDRGISISAVHNHVIAESKRMLFMHVGMRGDPTQLAQIIKAALAKTATPTGEAPEETPMKVDWSAAEKTLGSPEEAEGKRVEFVFPRADRLKVHGMAVPSTSALETADEASFQMFDADRAVAYAEFLLKTDEVNPTIRAFSAGGFTVEAIHNHMIDDDPHMIFIHAWGSGQLKNLANTVAAALKQSDTRFRTLPGH